MSFSFGTPSSAPANTSLTGGFNFGANKPATPGFGLPATSQPSTGLFNNTSAAPAFGTGTGFGLSSTPAFGTTSTAPAFGSATTPAFGATTTPAFGASSTAPTFGSTTTPAFGSTSSAPAFGATSAAPSFGATTTPAFGAPSTTPAFGGASTTGFGASTSAPAFGSTTTPAFGTSGTPAFGATTTPSFGTSGLGTGSLNFGAATTTTASSGLNFGAPATTKTGLGGLGGFGFGTTTAAQSSFGLLGGTSTATTTTSLFGLSSGTTNVSGTQPSTSATPSLGLGGVAPTGTGTGSSTTGDGKTEPPKQTKLPNEISTLVDSFKEFVKKQKSLSSEVMRVSIKPLHKVGREAEATLRAALALRGETNKARAQSRRLRAAAADALAAAEAAARDPPGAELEGSAPPKYIKELIAELEQQLITFRRQMDVADKQMQASPKLLTEQELTLGIRRMHESLVALAGRLQAVHTQVEAQKEQYLNLRKYILKDPTNVFDRPSPSASLDQILHDAEGTRKKTKSSSLADISFGGAGSAVLSDPKVALSNIQQLAGPPPFTYLGSTLSPFHTADVSGSNWQPQPQSNYNTSLNLSNFGSTSQTESSSAFQLQKPPGKRGKQ
ncbi:unnamed protein product [Parnassius mnemosyne]|uniref:Nucleoporin Nup58 n=1 Tax=Parnassius mnemosyne TaxID=213953 RepID=A0AAV1L5F0_9NEOP